MRLSNSRNFHVKNLTRLFFICAFIAILIYGFGSSAQQVKNTNQSNKPKLLRAPKLAPYADNNGEIDESYSGSTFKLSYQYPKQLPPIAAAVQQLSEKYAPLTKQNVDAFLLDLRKYVYDDLLPVDWYADQIKDPQNGWYNSPWMGEANYLTGWPGREFIRGMYLGSIQGQPGVLGPAQTEPYYSYAIELYNNRGGYTLGKVWADINKPDIAACQFPEGTVVAKLNVTPSSLKQIPQLAGSIEWQLFITPANAGPGIVFPQLTTCRHSQIDIILKDKKLSPETGWVYCTYVYDATAKGNGWEKMVPSGLMIGNDPGVTPADVKRGTKLQQTLISSMNPPLNKNTLGWAGRLSGPADNGLTSSCLSCHGTAQWDPVAPLVPTAPTSQKTPLTPQQRLAWFLNNPGNVPFTTGQIATDYDWALINAAQNAMSSNGALTTGNEAQQNRRFKRIYK